MRIKAAGIGIEPHDAGSLIQAGTSSRVGPFTGMGATSYSSYCGADAPQLAINLLN